MDNFLNLIKSLVQVPDRFNPVAQTKAVMSMPQPQAQSYRQQVEKTVPRLSTSPQNMTNPYAMIGAQTINALPNSVSGLAKLPGARTPGQFASDAWNMAQAPLAAATLTARPQAPQPAFQPNLSPMNHSDLAEKLAGWQPGVKANFDYALLTRNANLVKQLLPQVPKAYLSSFAQQIGTILGSGA